mmetsp:Transcript_24562/g.52926  ORF Transcript_24562/g.52926 Transcript_24562/m.52926 type:complete len:1345 (-) Transcript_24562:161-4195(-)
MGYEEVETVLPADFVPQADPVLEDRNNNAAAAPHEMVMSDSEPESDAEDATCGGKLKKKKKKRSGRSTNRKSILGQWRARSKSRSKSKSREKKGKETLSSDSTPANGDGGDEKKKKKKRSGRSFRTIKKTDSNSTEVVSNTTSAKTKEQKEEEPEGSVEERELAAINTSAPLPTVREGSPANTTITDATGDQSVGGEEAAAAKEGIASPSPAPTLGSTELSIEIGDENEQFEFQVESRFNAKSQEVAAAKEEIPDIVAAPSKDTSVRSTKSNRSTKSSASVKSSRSTKSSRSIKSTKSGSEKAAAEAAPAIAASPSSDAASVRSTRSTKSTKSNRSTKSNKSAKSNKSTTTAPALGPAITAALASDAASVRSKSEEKGTAPLLLSADAANDDAASVKSNKSSRSTKSSKSTKSTSSKRSLRSLKFRSRSKSKDAKDSNKNALVIADKATDAALENASTEEKTSDKEITAADDSSPVPVKDSSSKGKWVKKVSLSIGGYKTSFQFSDPMANLADAVNDALNVVGNDNVLADQAKELDGINAESINGEEEEERDYDENPTRLFMYLQQRAWGLALTQLQKNPDEARVWVYRKAKAEKAPNVPDAATNPEAMVVQHSSLVVHDGTEAPKFRWKLLPLHAAIVLGAPTEIIQDIIRANPSAAKKTDERGSLPVHLAASRLDVDPEGEKVVLQLFGAYPDSIELEDRKGRNPPELAKLARARKEIEEQRKNCDGSSEGSSGDGSGDDDDQSVKSKSSLSGRFSQMLRGSKSTDTVDQRKKKKKKDKKKGSSFLGLASAKSMDGGVGDDETVADDATIVESLGPGFAFVKTSEAQEMRERTASEEEEEQQTKEDLIFAAKKAMIAREYLTPESAPSDTYSPQSIPLPMSFSLGDDGPPVVERKVFFWRGDSSSDEKTSVTMGSAATGAKSVTIADKHQVHEIQNNDIPDTETAGSDDSTEVTNNEGILVLLEKAVENAGRGGMDVTEFAKVLEDEWVTDVEALRRLDGETLDDLLPLMLSRELQRLINHADSIDNKFLKEDRQTLARGRSPKKSTKKKKKKRSHRRAKKRNHHRPVTPPVGPLTPITEEMDSPGSANSDDHLSVYSAAQTVYASARSAPPNLDTPNLVDNEETEETSPATSEDQEEEQDEYEPTDEDDLAQSASIEDLEIRKLHANLIADARTKFPTREALEYAIRERQTEVEAAVNSGFSVDRETLARAALADDEVRKLLPLRLILPTSADLCEMISVLQMHKEDAMRDLDMHMARSIQSEIDELQDQINMEERYLLTKTWAKTQCVGCGDKFPTEKRMKGVLRTKEMHCEQCRDGGASGKLSVRGDIENVDIRDDEAN